MENPNQELLSISISPTGSSAIRRLAGITRWMLILSTIAYLFLFVNSFIQTVVMKPEQYVSRPSLYWNLRLHPWMVGLYGVMGIFSLYWYFRFVRGVNKGLDSLDSEQFNKAFDGLCRFTLAWVLYGVVSVLLGALDLWVGYDLLQAR